MCFCFVPMTFCRLAHCFLLTLPLTQVIHEKILTGCCILKTAVSLDVLFPLALQQVICMCLLMCCSRLSISESVLKTEPYSAPAPGGRVVNKKGMIAPQRVNSNEGRQTKTEQFNRHSNFR